MRSLTTKKNVRRCETDPETPSKNRELISEIRRTAKLNSQ
jgi:hypothetical protein